MTNDYVVLQQADTSAFLIEICLHTLLAANHLLHHPVALTPTNSGKVPETLIRWMTASVLSALGYIHSRGYVHLAVSPSSVVIVPSGRICLVKLYQIRS